MNTLPGTVPGAVQTFARDERSLWLTCDGAQIAISVVSPQLVRVRMAPSGSTFAARRSWAVTPPDEDFAVVPFEVDETPEHLNIRTEALTVQIERANSHISFVDAAGKIFCADADGLQAGPPPEGQPLFVTDVALDPARRVACSKRIEEGEHFFGFGERTGQLDKKGRQLINWTTDPAIDTGHGIGTDPLYMAIPACLVLRPGLCYGVFFNNTWRSRFGVAWDQPDSWMIEAHGGEMDYYVLYGPTPAEVVERLGGLLGTIPLPPRWALGYHQSRWGYSHENAVRDLADNFRQRAIPCDVIHLDIDYMDGYRVFTWHPERFNDPARLLNDLRAAGFRTVTIIDPGVKVDRDYRVCQSGLEHDMFIRRADGEVFQGYVWPGAAYFPDFVRPDARQWWGDYIKDMVESGVSGIWNDMNEPTSFDRDFSEGIGVVGTLPTDAMQGPPDERTTHDEVHNLYGSGMAQATYEGLCRHRPAERPFVLTRSGFAGIQRWSACWMGDNHSVWEHLEMTMPQLLNMGLSGVPFVGTDIGGFFGHCNGELLARWTQLGALVPFARGHSSLGTADQEPWVFGPRVEAICRDYLNLRYRLMPYLYTLFWEASQRGAPVLRPLLYHFPDDPATYPIHDQVLLGPSVMAAPIYQPRRTARSVYLPAGTWYDWWTGAQFSGPTNILADAPLERMPLYVRAGTILPTGPEMAYTDEKPLNPLTLDLYPGDGMLTLYEDDGRSFNYQQGEFCTTEYKLRHNQHEHALIFTIAARTGAYTPPPRQVVVRLHDIGEQPVQGFSDIQYDHAHRTLSLAFDDDGAERTITFATG